MNNSSIEQKKMFKIYQNSSLDNYRKTPEYKKQKSYQSKLTHMSINSFNEEINKPELNIDDDNFDIFMAKKVTENQELLIVMYKTFHNNDLFNNFKIDINKFNDFWV